MIAGPRISVCSSFALGWTITGPGTRRRERRARRRRRAAPRACAGCPRAARPGRRGRQAAVDLLHPDLAAVAAHAARRGSSAPARPVEQDRHGALAQQVAAGGEPPRALRDAGESRSAIASSRSPANAAMCGWMCSRSSASPGSHQHRLVADELARGGQRAAEAASGAATRRSGPRGPSAARRRRRPMIDAGALGSSAIVASSMPARCAAPRGCGRGSAGSRPGPGAWVRTGRSARAGRDGCARRGSVPSRSPRPTTAEGRAVQPRPFGFCLRTDRSGGRALERRLEQLTGSPLRRSDVSAASMTATISRPSCGVRARRRAGPDRVREVLQLEAERLGGLDARDDDVAAAVAELVLAEVRRRPRTPCPRSKTRTASSAAVSSYWTMRWLPTITISRTLRGASQEIWTLAVDAARERQREERHLRDVLLEDAARRRARPATTGWSSR